MRKDCRLIFEVSFQDFQEKVVEASKKQPILVDFWAEWCGPCRSLTPVLEQIIAERQGSISLAKVNTETEAELAQRFGIRGIPAVKLFIDGVIKAEFQGALSKKQIEDFLAQHSPSREETKLEEAKELIDQLEIDSAVSIILELLQDKPDLASGHLLLAKAWLLNGKIDHAKDQIQLCDPQNVLIHEMKEYVNLLEGLVDFKESSTVEAESFLAKALSYFQSGDWSLAFEQLLSSIHANKGFEEARAQKTLVAAFKVLGARHPLTIQYQKSLARALY